MKFAVLSVLASLTLGAQAHFRLLYPAPRGEFNAPEQVNFCSGYTDATANRTTFPLSNGFFRIRQGHPDWAASVIISAQPNPSSFDDFRSGSGEEFYFARYWANESAPGNFCIPLDLSDIDVPGVEDGANVTVQIALAGGDGDLYQCADLTLSSTYTIPADLQGTCVNETESSDHSDGGEDGADGEEHSDDDGHDHSQDAADSDNAGNGKFEHMSLLKAVGVAVVGAMVGVVSL